MPGALLDGVHERERHGDEDPDRRSDDEQHADEYGVPDACSGADVVTQHREHHKGAGEIHEEPERPPGHAAEFEEELAQHAASAFRRCSAARAPSIVRCELRARFAAFESWRRRFLAIDLNSIGSLGC